MGNWFRGRVKQSCVFKSRTQFRFAFLHQTLGFSFFTVHRIKRFASFSSLTSWKISSFPGGDAIEQNRSHYKQVSVGRSGGRSFAHTETHAHTYRSEGTMLKRACLQEGMKSHAESSLLNFVFYGEFHTFFHVGAVLITVLVGVSKAVFLLVGRYI